MSDPIQPALTPLEWKRRVTSHGQSQHPRHGRLELALLIEDDTRVTGDPLHALAALALYGQPFGFTWEDVDTLRGVVNELLNSEERAPVGLTGWKDDATTLNSLVNRIAALLPPREE